MDIARGIAILMVIVGHVLRGLFAAKLLAPAGWALWLDSALYVSHLPLFAFATGLLMPRSVEKLGRGRYLRRRAWFLAYVYLVWTVIQGTAEVLTSRLKNVPVSWLDVVTVWTPLGHLWFLPALLVASVLVVLVAPWRSGALHVLGGVLLIAAGLGVWGWELPWAGLQGPALLVFYAAGAWVTHDRLQRMTRVWPTSLLVLGGAASVVWVLVLTATSHVTEPTVVDMARTPGTILSGVLASCLAVAGILALAISLARIATPLTEALGHLGRLSLVIYLAHILFTAGARVALSRVGVDNVVVHLLVGTLLGVLGPLVLERVTRRVPALFEAPDIRALTR